MKARKRLVVALALYAILGVLIWSTMSDVPVKIPEITLWTSKSGESVKIPGGSISIRALPLAFLAAFAARTVLHWKAEQIRAKDEKKVEG